MGSVKNHCKKKQQVYNKSITTLRKRGCSNPCFQKDSLERMVTMEIGMLPMILILIGIGLLVAEIFIPSFGMTGLLGIVSIVAAIVLTAETLGQGIVMFLVILVIVLVLMFFAYRIVASRRSPLILKDSVKEEDAEDLQYYLGKEGVALSILRPAGKGDFDGVRLDVLTEGGFIPKGSDIVITNIEGKKIFVKVVKEGN